MLREPWKFGIFHCFINAGLVEARPYAIPIEKPSICSLLNNPPLNNLRPSGSYNVSASIDMDLQQYDMCAMTSGIILCDKWCQSNCGLTSWFLSESFMLSKSENLSSLLTRKMINNSLLVDSDILDMLNFRNIGVAIVHRAFMVWPSNIFFLNIHYHVIYEKQIRGW